MPRKIVSTSLEEDFKALNITNFSEAEQCVLGGVSLTEGEEGDEKPDTDHELSEGKGKKVKCEDCGEMYDEGGKCKCKQSDKEASESSEEDDNADDSDDNDETSEDDDKGGKQEESTDPFATDDVTMAMFDAIMDLPYDDMEEGTVKDVLDGLAKKNLPEDAEEPLKLRAEEVVKHLLGEVAAKKTRRHGAGKMSKKATFQCPQGTRKDPENPKRCVRAAKAVGGAGALAKEGRKKKKWAKTGAGKKSSKKSSRWAARREDVNISPFAMELASLVEDVSEEKLTVRDDIIGQMSRIFDLLHEEFLDETVSEIFSEACEDVFTSWENGRLDEDLMSEDEFMSEIKPLLTLIHKSLGEIYGDDGGLGNG